MFEVGQKVVCINAAWTVVSELLVYLDNGKAGIREIEGPRELEENKVYIVRWVGVQDGATCVRVRDLIRCGIDGDKPFRADRFRPVVQKKTDISIFTQMLTPSGKKLEDA